MEKKQRLYKRIFSKEIVNNDRQKELDLAKAVLIFCLALVHCIIECTPEEKLVSGVPYLFDSVIGGALGAPMFMFAMGAGMVYARHQAPGDYARRSIRLGLAGYTLNICRYLLPFLLGYLFTGDYEKYIIPLPYRVLGDDILQFAALAMLMMGLFVRLRLSCGMMFGISLLMSVLGTCFCEIDVGNPLGNIFLGYFFGIEDAAGMVFSDFPLFNWMIIPVCGYIFAQFLLHVKNKNLFYAVVSTIGVLVTVIYFPLGIQNEWGMFGEGQNCYYHLRTIDAAVSLAAAIGALGIYHVIICYIPDKVMAVAKDISYNITNVYCIHWVFVVLITNVVLYIWRGTQELPVVITLLLGTGISIVAMIIAHFWSDRRRKSR